MQCGKVFCSQNVAVCLPRDLFLLEMQKAFVAALPECLGPLLSTFYINN